MQYLKQEVGDDLGVCVLNLEFVELKVAISEMFSYNASLKQVFYRA